MSPSVLVADDHHLSRAGLRALLETDADCVLVDEVAHFEQILPALLRHRPDVLLLDLRWRRDDNGALAAIQMFKAAISGLRVIVLSAHEDLVFRGRKAGADVALLKDFSRDELLQAIHGAPPSPDLDGVASPRQREANLLLSELGRIPTGSKDAHTYEQAMVDLLKIGFAGHLTDFRSQCRHCEGREIWDCVALNISPQPFWQAMRTQHRALQVIFELKNVAAVKPSHIIQLADYLAEPLSKLGILISRAAPGDAVKRRAAGLLRERGIAILMLTDDDIREIVRLAVADTDPTPIVKDAYLVLTRT